MTVIQELSKAVRLSGERKTEAQDGEGLTSFEALAAGFLAHQKPLVSAQGYVSLAGLTRRVLAWFEAEDLEVVSVGIGEAVRFQAWLGDRRDDAGRSYSSGTIHNYLKVARRFFDWLVSTEQRKDNPFREVRYPRLAVHLSRNVLTEAQMGRLLAELAHFERPSSVRAQLRRYRVHVVAELLYSTGLRIAEACSLTADNLDLETRLVYLPQGKANKPRTAFLTGYAAEVLGQYLRTGRAAVLGSYGRGHGHTLLGAHYQRLGSLVNQELESVCRSLDLPVITSHGFRHSLGTHLLRSGCDMRHIQVILGHEALATTQIYTRVDKEDLRRSLDEYHPRQMNPRESLHG
jgi:site-specific recombinase XerD